MKLHANTLTRLFLCATLVCAIAMHSGMAKAEQATAAAGQNNVMAIDILLEPDATMIQHAQAANARLLKNFPKGFTLGGSHAPHVTVLQLYVNTADLDKVYAAASKVFANENPTSWKLKAVKYVYTAEGTIGLGAIAAEPTADLLRLQQELIDAVAPFIVPTGSAAAFVTTPEDPDIVAPLIPYVAAFARDHSGGHFTPHVTVGVGTTDFWNAMLAEPFDAFTFSPAGASVYHLGNYGTAMTLLHSFKPKN
jgi:2'-5' RNA ligase superfamily